MRKLEIGSEKYTQVFAEDEKKFNANHRYRVQSSKKPQGWDDVELLTEVKFQCGPIKENEVNGCANEDLIVMVIDRLQSFQKSEFNCRENALAITKLEEALFWLRARTVSREKRGVEGTDVV